MATWLDWAALVIVGAIFIGIVIGVMKATEAVSNTVKNTKEQMKKKGLTISDSGISIKTSGRYDREDYVNNQRSGFIKAMGAASFGTADNVEKKPVMSRQTSLASTDGFEASNGSGSGDLHREASKEKKGRFNLRRGSKD